MKIIKMNPTKTDAHGKTVAFFDIQTDDGIIIRGFRIVNGTKGFFIASPEEKGKDGNYYERVMLPKELKERLEKLALEEFNKNK